MMTIALVLGLLTIIGIARCNKSVSLFLILLVSMLGGFAGGAIISRLTDGTDNTKATQVQPMQAIEQGIGLFALFDTSNEVEGEAGKAETPARDIANGIIAPSNELGSIPLEKPPQEVAFISDS
jgi:hypothetical protein